MTERPDAPTLDASDLDQYMGVPMEPGELKEPVATQRHPALGAGDALPEPAPLRRGVGGGEPLRRASWRRSRSPSPRDTSHGCSPAQVGMIPNSHLIFGGDDWWFFGPRV